MSATPPARSGRAWVRRMIITLYLAGVNAVLLGRMTTDVQAGQKRLVNLSNADREMLLLLQSLTPLGERTDPDDVRLQAGLMFRQLTIAAAAFPERALVRRSERRVKALHSAEEQSFYSTTIDSLDAKQNSRTALGVLVGMVIVLGAGGLAGEGRFRSLVQRRGPHRAHRPGGPGHLREPVGGDAARPPAGRADGGLVPRPRRPGA
jgi:hypothetical protein